MRLKVAAILCVMCLFTGCKNANEPLDRALALRSKILDSNGCQFHATVTADYGEKQYTFSMNCTTDKEGNLTFTVAKPDTLSGITGKITADGGAITFDDKVLAFQTMADGQVTPVMAPWLYMKTLRGGYLNGCTMGKDCYTISIDDTYEADALHLEITVRQNLPMDCEIFWKGRRVLTIAVENFTYL